MSDFTRVTVVGASKRADVVVASDEPYAGLLPRFLDILGEPIAESAHPIALVRVTGEELDLSSASDDQDVLDGEVLHLVRRTDAPPPPEVADVTDAVAESLGSRHDLWGEAARRSVAATVIGACAAIAGSGWTAAETPSDLRPMGVLGVVLGVAILLALGALASGRAGARWPAIVCTAASTGLALPIGGALADLDLHVESTAMGAAGAMLWAWVALGLGAGVALRRREVLLAAAIGVVLAGVAGAMWLTPSPGAAGWGVVAIIAVLALGLLPWYAMSVSGLTGLDDRVVGGDAAPRTEVTRSLDAAYRSLTWATAAIAVPIGIAAAALVTSHDPWAIALGITVIVVTALRTRSLPLTAQGVFLWSAVAVASIIGATQMVAIPWVGGASIVAIAVVAALLAGVRPALHQRARLRALGNAIEGIAVVILLPLLLGAFGLYERLLGTF